MNTPIPCNSCNHLYYDALFKNDPFYISECKLCKTMGNMNCENYNNYEENNIPKGWKKIEGSIYINETNSLLVITGDPSNNNENHNCDEMGCGSVEHIILRAKVTANGV